MRTVLLLDLEDTIITDWDTFQLINADKINTFFKNSALQTDIGLFSFAVWNDKDFEHFKQFQSHIETNFCFKFTTDFMFTVERIKHMVEAKSTLWSATVSEFLNNWDKETALLTLVKNKMFHDCHVTLIDDRVRSMKVDIFATHTLIDFININDL